MLIYRLGCYHVSTLYIYYTGIGKVQSIPQYSYITRSNYFRKKIIKKRKEIIKI